MGFLKNATSPRAVILGSALGSAVLGWMVYQRSLQLKQLAEDVEDAPRVVQDIQHLSQELSQLQGRLAREGLLRTKDDMASFIRTIAGHPDVQIGQVRVTPNPSSPMRGVIDHVYKIDPQEKGSRFSRLAIANFLYSLEQDGPRVKVTSIQLQPAGRGQPKPGVTQAEDAWTFDASLTLRTAEADI